MQLFLIYFNYLFAPNVLFVTSVVADDKWWGQLSRIYKILYSLPKTTLCTQFTNTCWQYVYFDKICYLQEKTSINIVNVIAIINERFNFTVIVFSYLQQYSNCEALWYCIFWNTGNCTKIWKLCTPTLPFKIHVEVLHWVLSTTICFLKIKKISIILALSLFKKPAIQGY